MIKIYMYAALLIGLVFGFTTFIYKWHYDPIDRLETKVEEQSQIIIVRDREIENLEVTILEMSNNNRVDVFDAFIEGVLDESNNTGSSDKLIF